MEYRVEIKADLKRNSYKGIFVAMEGIDGSGKTTQTEALKKYFTNLGHKVVLAKSPRRDKGIIAEVNKKILEGQLNMPKPAFQYLFSADYIVQTEEIIIPALKKGQVVITDRFHPWSSVAYGIWENSRKKSYDVGLAQFILVAHGLFSKTYQLVVPDITFYFDISSKTALKRMSKKAKEMYEKKDVLEKVMKGYNWLIREFPEEFNVINGDTDIKKITKEVIDTVERVKKA
jgi:dTMP kinase